ncbi:hypothetical protein [Streptomyces sp. 8P21H-1]|nr:hypothetical protein [Streptomyces sp. 8P21H-1]
MRESGVVAYALPDSLVALPKLPLTGGGKIGKKELRRGVAG